jgi:Peptidase inhibitor family I36
VFLRWCAFPRIRLFPAMAWHLHSTPGNASWTAVVSALGLGHVAVLGRAERGKGDAADSGGSTDMASRTSIAWVASLAVLAAAPEATAQGSGPFPREGACFFEDTNYRGRYFCVEAGDELGTMPSGANDRVSSIRVLGRPDVRVYRDARFRGESRRLGANVPDLDDEDFDDAISSIRVEGRSPGGRARGERYGSANPELIVTRAYQDVLQRDPDPSGMRTYRSRIIDDGWSEQQVREDLRRSPEYREKNTMTLAKAEEIVRQAYLTVLNREPDPASRGFVDEVFRRRMTREQLESTLRASAEYRDRNR